MANFPKVTDNKSENQKIRQMQTENAEMLPFFPPMPECVPVLYTGLGSIIQLVARTCKSARQAGGHLRKCFCDHHFDKAISSPPHTLHWDQEKWLLPCPHSAICTPYSEPIIIVIIFITLPGTLLPSSLFLRQISLVGRENWVSNLLWQAGYVKGSGERREIDLCDCAGLMCVLWWGTRRESSR